MIISVSVKPHSERSELEKREDGSFLVHLKSAPIDGKANAEMIRLLSKYFHVPQANIVIKRGGSGKKKTVEIPT